MTWIHWKQMGIGFKISTIKEELSSSLLSIALKLLSSEHICLHHLSKYEQQLWNSFNKANSYKFLTGEKDSIPEFQFDWISPEAPAFWWPAQFQAEVQPAQPVQPLPHAMPPAPQAQPEQQPQPELHSQPIDVQPAQACPQSQVQVSDRVLRDKKPIDHKELNTGIKKKCK
jgi:hypothetical protein